MENGMELSDENLPNPDKLKFENILKAIDDSPIPGKVKEQAKTALLPRKSEYDSWLGTALYSAPERDMELEITYEVLDLIGPLFIEYGISLPNGRNTIRNIYKAIGGRQTANFE